MKNIYLLLGILLVLGAASAASGKKGDMDKADLSRYRWRHRLLLIFSPSAQTPAFQQLANQLKQQREGMGDRDLIVFSIMSDGQSRVGEDVLSKQKAKNLRRRFQVTNEEFRVMLIGKDGTVKLSEPTVKLSEVFALIDSMPMRQREMREKAR